MEIKHTIRRIFGNIFLLAFSLIGFYTCNEAGSKQQDTEISATGIKDSPTINDVENSKEETKWKADDNTNKNVASINAIIQNANQLTLNDYVQTSHEIETIITKMLKECKMKGADHEALHHWLEPLIEYNKSLSASANTDQAKTIFEKLKNQMNIYPSIFE
ncbi:MAG: hypothetical protein JSU03_08650 [Bacteroidetes bacterium]|nr:hypothetical protein [Bacteroidota bacterium]MBS1757333.1 hypothetical protein [Bacteroidota bacterium]